MKILIISVIRVGGTYLFESLSKTYSIKNKIFEPKELIKPTDSTIVKLNVGMIDNDDIISYSKYFEHIVILDRKDKRAQAESASVSKVTKKPHSKYSVISFDKNLVKKWEDFFSKSSESLKVISNKINKKIYYYEDIYYGNVKIDNLTFNPDVSKKLRVTKKVI